MLVGELPRGLWLVLRVRLRPVRGREYKVIRVTTPTLHISRNLLDQGEFLLPCMPFIAIAGFFIFDSFVFHSPPQRNTTPPSASHNIPTNFQFGH